MAEKEMTKEEIILGLECCQTAYDKQCEKCPYSKLKKPYIMANPCSSIMRKDALNLLKRLVNVDG